MTSKLISDNKQEMDTPPSNNDTIFHNKVGSALEGLNSFFERKILEKTSRENAEIIVDYILALKTEINLSLGYKQINIVVLVKLCKFLSQQNLKVTGREEIISFLDSLRRTEASDPLHKWIGTYNLFRILLVRFFKWLYSPQLEQKQRPKPTVVENIPQLKRKEQSIYKPTDLWSSDDDLLFLKYCTSKRDQCYHAISRDLSCRPSEILNLRLKDVVFKTSGTYQYAEVLVNGKTGSRHIPLINSIPWLKDWLDQHPQRGNPNAFLVPSLGDRSYSKKMSSLAMNLTYRRYRLLFFPKLLQAPSVLPEDKLKISELLKKPWNPYLRRHVGLTEKSKILKENILKQYSGWSGRSQMHLKYLHYFGNESSESLLEAYGLKPKFEEIDKMRPKQCPNCSESNKPDSRFCAKCRMVLSYDAYTETIEGERQNQDKLTHIEKRFDLLQSQLLNVLSGLNEMNPKDRNTFASYLFKNKVIEKEENIKA